MKDDKNKIIVTNKNWFIRYSILRISAIAFAMVVFTIPPFLKIDKTILINTLDIFTISILLTILIFDFIQKPSYLELIKSESGYILRQFHPDSRYLFFFQERKVDSVYVKNEDVVSCKVFKGLVPLLNQIEFQVTKPDTTKVKSKKINIAWMNHIQLNRLNQYINKSN